MVELTYQEIGATERDELPDGYYHVRMVTELGRGEGTMALAAEAVMTFAVQRGAGLRPFTSAPRAAVGVDVTCRPGLGPLSLSVPCRVVWAADEPRRAGFGYGTLPGHPERGEEGFIVNHDADDIVRFHVRAFSAPARWFTRAAGPLAHVMQDAAARRYLATMRRLVR